MSVSVNEEGQLKGSRIDTRAVVYQNLHYKRAERDAHSFQFTYLHDVYTVNETVRFAKEMKNKKKNENEESNARTRRKVATSCVLCLLYGLLI